VRVITTANEVVNSHHSDAATDNTLYCAVSEGVSHFLPHIPTLPASLPRFRPLHLPSRPSYRPVSPPAPAPRPPLIPHTAKSFIFSNSILSSPFFPLFVDANSLFMTTSLLGYSPASLFSPFSFHTSLLSST